MGEKDILDLNLRRRIYNFILKSPGMHEREIARQLNIPLSTLDYHINYLRKRGLIIEKADARFTRFYIFDKIGVKDKQIIGVLRQSVFRKIILYILLHSESIQKEISNHIGLAPSTTSFHLNKLTELNVVSRTPMGRETLYSIIEPEYISDLFIAYRKSFYDDAVDRFVETWLELHPRHVRKTKKEKGEINFLSLFGTW